MRNLATVAKSHLEKIQHYHDHSGTSAYSLALDHFRKLSELTVIVRRSKGDSDDEVAILQCINAASPLMAAMEARQ